MYYLSHFKTSHKPEQARFKYNIPRSRIGGLRNRDEMTWGRDDQGNQMN